MGAYESGQSFLAGVLAKLPESQRAQAQEIFKAAEAKEAVTLVGDATLARSDYSKHMDELREKEVGLNEHYQRLNSWYEVNKDALDEYKTLKATPPTNTTVPAPNASNAQANTGLQSPAMTPEEMRRIADQSVNDAGRDYIAVASYIAGLVSQHQSMFNEPLDTLAISHNPKVGKPIVGQPGRIFSLQDAYNELHGTRVAEKQKEARERAYNDEVEKRVAERLKANTSHPFPLRNESSPLDVLATKDGSAAHTLDTAVAEYERLQSARGS
jgi:hypothetical protein